MAHLNHCMKCGRGFLAGPADPMLAQRFCKRKCAIAYKGKAWRPGMWEQRKRKLTLAEKMALVESL